MLPRMTNPNATPFSPRNGINVAGLGIMSDQGLSTQQDWNELQAMQGQDPGVSLQAGTAMLPAFPSRYLDLGMCCAFETQLFKLSTGSRTFGMRSPGSRWKREHVLISSIPRNIGAPQAAMHILRGTKETDRLVVNNRSIVHVSDEGLGLSAFGASPMRRQVSENGYQQPRYHITIHGPQVSSTATLVASEWVFGTDNLGEAKALEELLVVRCPEVKPRLRTLN